MAKIWHCGDCNTNFETQSELEEHWYKEHYLVYLDKHKRRE